MVIIICKSKVSYRFLRIFFHLCSNNNNNKQLLYNYYFSPFTLLTWTHIDLSQSYSPTERWPRNISINFLIEWRIEEKVKKEVHTRIRRCVESVLRVSFRGNEPSTALYLFPFVARTFRFAIDEKRLVKGFEKYTPIHADKKTFYSIQRKEAGPTLCWFAHSRRCPSTREGWLRCFEVRRDALESGCNAASSIYASFFRVFDAWRFDTKPIDAHPLYNVTR